MTGAGWFGIGYGVCTLLAWRFCARVMLADLESIGAGNTGDVVSSMLCGFLVALFWPLVLLIAAAYHLAGPWFFPEFYAERRRRTLDQARARVASLERELGIDTAES